MNYKIYKLDFLKAAHFGNGMLNDSEYGVKVDTFFSGICLEALKLGVLDNIVNYVTNRKLVFSDLFPFVKNDVLLIPKPMIYIDNKDSGDSIIKKKAKKIKYLSIDQLDHYLSGDINSIDDYSEEIGSKITETKASISEEKTTPYHIGQFYFKKGSGLYTIVGYETEEELSVFDEVFKSLSYSGVGGKRSSGLGRFNISTMKLPKSLSERINELEKYEYKMILSSSLPKEEELKLSIEGSSNNLDKRSGFVYSDIAENNIKKKDLFVFSSGSCFKNIFEGDVYDVSQNNVGHPVYRYAIPMFMGAK